jgi:hypothetical protein
VRVGVFLDIDDSWLDARVAEFNASAPAHDSAEVNRDEYVENVVRELLVEDAIPVTLFQWDVKVSMLMDPARMVLPLRTEQEAALVRTLLRRHIGRGESNEGVSAGAAARLLERMDSGE